MGQFTQVSITVEFNDESKAEAFNEIVDNLDDELVKRGEDEGFHTAIESVVTEGSTVYIELSSSRYQNAEWQAEMISKIARDEFKGFAVRFDATESIPDTIIYWDADHDEEE